MGESLAKDGRPKRRHFASWPWMILTRASKALGWSCDGVGSRVRSCQEKQDEEKGMVHPFVLP